MEENLVIKNVNFMTDELLSAKDVVDNKIYVAVSYVCKALYFSEGQMKHERNRVQTDFVLNKGVRNLVLPTKGGKQITLCIEINYLPLWLAKISITPSMRSKKKDTVEKLIAYQLKAKDVLSNAFLQTDYSDFSPGLKLCRAMLEEMEKIEKRQNYLENELHDNSDVIHIVEPSEINDIQSESVNTDNINDDWRKDSIRTVTAICKGKGKEYYKKTWECIYKAVEEKSGISLYEKLAGLKIKAAREGKLSATAIKKLNRLDVIENNSMLKTILLKIISKIKKKNKSKCVA